ncbi:MAG: ATP-binding protein [Ferruginibacter sp.]
MLLANRNINDIRYMWLLCSLLKIKRKRLLFITTSACCQCLVFLCLQLILLPSTAQQPYSLVHFDENDLPQTTIGNIQQDETGYLWMSSQFGIVRFDGEKFRVFTTSNLKGLTSNRLRLCVKGPDKSIWFVDENNTFIKVKSHNQFEILSQNEAVKKRGLAFYTSEGSNDINYLKPGNMSYQDLITFLNYDPTKEALKSFTTGIKSGYIFYIDQRQQTKLLYYENDQYSLKSPPGSFNAQHSFKLGNLIAAQISFSEAIVFNQNQTQKKIRVTGLPTLLSPVFNTQSLVLFSHESGTFFYAGGKLYEYKLQDNAIVATLIFENLPCTGVVNVMRERTTGDYFISTKSEGIYRVKKKRFSVISLIDSTSKTLGSTTEGNNIIYSINFKDAEHIVAKEYVAPATGTGISRLFTPADNGVLNAYFSHKKDDRYIWINYKDSLYSLDTKTRFITPLQQIYNPKKVIDFTDGTSFVLTARQILMRKNGYATELYHNDSLYFTTMEKVSESCLIIGSTTGVYYFFPAQKKLQVVPYKQPLQVRFIYKDRAGRLWFTTYSPGLFHISGTNITPLPLDNAGYLSISHSILEDNSGNFWITTNHGLFKVAYASLLSIIHGQSSKLYYTYFDKTDGFNTNEFNGGCYPSGLYHPETGRMFFPSMNGIVTFYPDSIKSVQSNSPVFFDEVVLNDTGHVYDVKNDAVFSRQISSIRLYFSSPYYGHASNIKFSYTLSSTPGLWNDLGSSRSVVLNNLSGGNYTLIIKKEEGTGSPVLTTLQFSIRKAFTETIWFKFLLVAFVIGVVFLYFKARILYLSNERRRLEKEVAARTADQVQLIGQLKETIANLTQLQQELSQMIGHKENIIAILIHDIKSPLHFLNTVSDHLSKSLATNPPEKNEAIAKEIAASLNRLYLFTQDFAIWLNASETSQIQKIEKVNLSKTIRESIAVYEEIIVKKGLSIRQQIAVGFVYGDASMIKSIIRNLVDNAVKNTASGSIAIDAIAITGTNACEITITDDGRGLTNEQLTELNDYFQSNKEILSFSSSHFGHKVIKDFIHKQKGKVHYRHNSPVGTAVIVTLPMRP